MEYSRLFPGARGQSRPQAGYYSQPGAALPGLHLLDPGHHRKEGPTEDHSRMPGSRHRNRVHDIRRDSSCYMGDGSGPGSASVRMARLETKDGVRVHPGIAVPKAEQSCAEILRTMERSEEPRPYGVTASGQVRHAGRAISPGATDSSSGDQARLEQNRKSDAACLNSRPTQDCRVCENRKPQRSRRIAKDRSARALAISGTCGFFSGAHTDSAVLGSSTPTWRTGSFQGLETWREPLSPIPAWQAPA